MKKIALNTLTFVLLVGGSSLSIAQTSNFTGWSATASLGYQSLKPKFDNVVDANARNYTVTASNGTGIVGKVGVDYTWALDAKYVMTAGLDYGLNYGKNSDVDAYRVTTGALAGSDRIKLKQNAGISIAPGMLIDKSTLAYIKFGYLNTTSKSESDGKKESGNAYVYGVGAKFLQSNDYYVFTGLDYLAGKKKSLSGDLSGDSKGSGYVVSAGIGKRF